MGYDASAYMYYGLMLDEEVDYDLIDKFPLYQVELTNREDKFFAIDQMGIGSGGEVYMILAASTTHLSIMESNYEHIELPLNINELNEKFKEDIEQFNTTYLDFLSEHGIAFKLDVKPGWIIGCYGS